PSLLLFCRPLFCLPLCSFLCFPLCDLRVLRGYPSWPSDFMLQKFRESNRNLLVNINGNLVHRDQAGISPFDSVVQGGDAVWEGLRLYKGRIFQLTEHLDRLRSSALALAFAQIPSHEEITEQIRRTLAANNMTDGVHI